MSGVEASAVVDTPMPFVERDAPSGAEPHDLDQLILSILGFDHCRWNNPLIKLFGGKQL